MQRCSEATAVVAQSCGSAVLLSCVSGVRTLGRLRLQQPSCLMGGRSISSAILLVISAPTALRYFAASTQARKPVASANVEPCGRLMFRELSRMWMGTRALVVFSESTLHRARSVLSHSCHLWPGIQCGAGCSSSVPGGSSERGGLEEPLAPLGVVLQKKQPPSTTAPPPGPTHNFAKRWAPIRRRILRCHDRLGESLRERTEIWISPISPMFSRRALGSGNQNGRCRQRVLVVTQLGCLHKFEPKGVMS